MFSAVAHELHLDACPVVALKLFFRFALFLFWAFPLLVIFCAFRVFFIANSQSIGTIFIAFIAVIRTVANAIAFQFFCDARYIVSTLKIITDAFLAVCESVINCLTDCQASTDMNSPQSISSSLSGQSFTLLHK